MELVLFLIAAGIIFYLYKTFQVYLSNPIVPNDRDVLQSQNRETPQQEVKPLSLKERLKTTEYGLIARIMGRLSFADEKSCILEEKLMSGIIHDMAHETDQPESLYLEIYKEARQEDIQELATLFASETIAQYKKRLKIIEFMFALSWADGELTNDEENCIIDVAAILEIENEDFNKLYDEFKANNTQKVVAMDKEEAMKLLGLQDGFTYEDLDKQYMQIMESKRQNIFDPKNLTRPFNQFGGEELKRYSQAYATLLTLATTQQTTLQHETQNQEEKIHKEIESLKIEQNKPL
ncbi:hypothetical protein CQA53_06720 [Helicobacter didelphidarum]|uniref:Co-chaperone DjlA N-terminal domain-containing protein n=1 Tax=Helicobacter didelphidarum TaxID=2040648 RepID=A0A3D8IJE7_9HELI|nr:TerB family tellurite resistance protein [Helicobacter didelphidarum]RDU65263.1 hypothetical protein CQA53_06720 [Helicobacter didelphidarum]